jgi:predicted dehydrogenase
VTHGFGIVGCGVIAATHAEAIGAIGGARLVAVTDPDAARAAAFARSRDCAAEPDLAALVSREDIEVICVCVPSGLHAEVGVEAAGAGKHLVIEKPMDVSLEAADRLIAAARGAGVRMTVISQHRFYPGPAELRRLLDRNALGRLVLGEAATKWHRTQEYYDSAAWRGTWALDGGSLLNQGIHYVDLLRWCMGPVADVTAKFATRAHRVETEDIAARHAHRRVRRPPGAAQRLVGERRRPQRRRCRADPRRAQRRRDPRLGDRIADRQDPR